MKTIHAPALLLLGLVTACGGGDAVPASADESSAPRRVRPGTEDAPREGLGEVFEDLVFAPLGGDRVRWSEHADGRPLVVVLRDSTCPICRKFGPELARLEERHAKDGPVFVFVNPMAQDDEAAMRDEAEALGFQGLYVPDKDHAIVARLAARSTAEVFLFDADRRLRYRGALDDRFGIGYARNEPREAYLEDAIAAVTSGEEVRVQATSAPGCVLALDTPVASGPTVTFHGRVSRILQERCQSCHRRGENAPFSLVSYEDVAGRRGMIRYTLRENLMPPWYAADDVGGPWANDLRMPDEERQVLLDWIAAGCPEGDPAGAPEPIPFVDGWKIGEPDAVIQVPDPIVVPAEGELAYQYALITTDFPEDRWVGKIELRASVPEAVHHILVFLHDDRYIDWKPEHLGHLALEGFFAIHSPGVEPIQYPPDRAKLLKKGQRLLFQIHYNPIGREVIDQPKLGLTFRDDPPEFPVLCHAASTPEIFIPPNTKDVKVSSENTIPFPARILGYVPHMHARGSAFLMELVYPDGKEEKVLSVPTFDFNWQQSYRLANPIDVPAGTKVRATGWFDNTADNPANPDPSQEVHFGLMTDDEMMIGYFEWMVRKDG